MKIGIARIGHTKVGIGHETASIDLYDRKILTSLPAVDISTSSKQNLYI